MENQSYMPKSKSDKWMTPDEVYLPLHQEFNFDHDPCPIDWKPGDQDGLTTEWGQSNFVNPPYSKVAKWIEKAHKEWKKGKTVVMLINAITDTKAFHDYIYNQAEIRFIKGRIKFINFEQQKYVARQLNPQEPTKRTPNVKASMIVIFK
jgi:site-specific DNA-methyltransferase (adenine-specific)